MSDRNIYELTSIARPLEPQFPTNRAVLILLPLIAIVCAAWQLVGPGDLPPVAAALTGTLAAFATWALTRELAPDDNLAAFVSLVFGTAAVLAGAVDAVLPTFVALFFVRIVNRSVGNPATRIDALVVLGLALGGGWVLDKPLLTWIGAIAFLFDARLPPGGAAFRFGPTLVALLVPLLWTGTVQIPSFAPQWPVTAFMLAIIAASVLYLTALITLRQVQSTGDATGVPLVPARVRAGMVIGLLLALESFIPSEVLNPLNFDALLWSCIAGVGVGNIAGKMRRKS